jgi:predicted O-methyltransferase YrrM
MRSVALTDKLYEYVISTGVRETPVQKELREATRKMRYGGMQIGPEQGALMQMLVRLTGARRCLEIGTFTGYSALAVALALPDDGTVVCCDTSEEWTAMARKYWKRAGVDKKIELHLAPALETLAKLSGPFDLVFIDADKPNYNRYYERSLELLTIGGLIAIDNTLWSGEVLNERTRDEDTLALQALNRKLKDDRRVDIVLVPIGDGLTLARKR